MLDWLLNKTNQKQNRGKDSRQSSENDHLHLAPKQRIRQAGIVLYVTPGSCIYTVYAWHSSLSWRTIARTSIPSAQSAYSSRLSIAMT